MRRHHSTHGTTYGPLMAAIVAATLCLALAGPASAQESTNLPTQLLKVTNVSLQSAHTLAQGVCRSAGIRMVTSTDGSTHGEPNCANIGYLEDESMLAVTATPEVIARVQVLLAEFDRLPETRAFQVIVLAADRSGENASEIPANVQQALQDVRDFLPYTGFSVLGSGWLRTSSYGETSLPGVGDREFAAELEFRPSTDPTAPILIERFSIVRRLPVQYNEGGGVTAYNKPILETTFTISPGETVVVGTSRLNGDDTAVVVLLTAIRD